MQPISKCKNTLYRTTMEFGATLKSTITVVNIESFYPYNKFLIADWHLVFAELVTARVDLD